jgi:HAE1 family hydrophobic/amphiphilic exporter-1
MTGQNFMAGAGSSYAMVILDLVDWKDRKGITNVDIIRTVMQKTSVIKDATIIPFS